MTGVMTFTYDRKQFTDSMAKRWVDSSLRSKAKGNPELGIPPHDVDVVAIVRPKDITPEKFMDFASSQYIIHVQEKMPEMKSEVQGQKMKG
jgi:hypothetical protein